MKVSVMFIIELGNKAILFMKMVISRMNLDQLKIFNKFKKILIFGMSKINYKIKII